MRNSFLFFLCSMMLVVSSCRKKTVLDQFDDLNGGGSFEVKIDGSNFNANLEVTAILDSDQDGDLNIAGINTNGSNVTLNIKSVSGTGTYTVADDQFAGFYVESNSTQYFADFTNGGTGTLNLTTFNNNKAKGTFNFTGINPLDGETIEVTNGSFDVTYVEE